MMAAAHFDRRLDELTRASDPSSLVIEDVSRRPHRGARPVSSAETRPTNANELNAKDFSLRNLISGCLACRLKRRREDDPSLKVREAFPTA